jgi:hypothetical protein
MTRFQLLLVSTIVLSGLIFFAYEYRTNSNPSTKLIEFLVEEQYTVQQVQVFEGHKFGLILEDDRRILVRLPVRSTPESKSKVTRLLNSSTKPRIVVLNKKASEWVVELYCTVNGQEISLSKWLSENHLVWDNVNG